MNKGFTLIELLVGISLIVILSGILFLGNIGEEKKLALSRAAYQLAQDFREVQEMAMAANEIDCGGGSMKHDFGIQFKSSWQDYYILFVDCSATRSRSGGDVDIRTVNLEEGVIISSLAPAGSFGVVFEAPDPTTYINISDWNKEARITLQHSDSGDTRVVKINSAGRIEIEQP